MKPANAEALAIAQADIRRAHANGGAGVLVSGLVWLLAGLVWVADGPQRAFVALFFSGMAIAPLGQALARLVFKAPASTVGKRLEMIALFTVPILLAGFYAGWRRIGLAPDLAIPFVAVAVGLRYLVFPMMYGSSLFLALGGTFVVAGGLAITGYAPVPGNLALFLGLVELICGTFLYRQWRAARPGW
jgi:hypothetical protein